MRRFLAALLSVTIAGGCATTKQPIESEETIAAQEARIRALRNLPDGEVTSVKRTDVGIFVAISVGSKDGLRVGDEYHLLRGGVYVGRPYP